MSSRDHDMKSGPSLYFRGTEQQIRNMNDALLDPELDADTHVYFPEPGILQVTNYPIQCAAEIRLKARRCDLVEISHV